MKSMKRMIINKMTEINEINVITEVKELKGNQLNQ